MHTPSSNRHEAEHPSSAAMAPDEPSSPRQEEPDMDACLRSVLLHAFRMEIVEVYAKAPEKELYTMLAHDIRGASIVGRVQTRVAEQFSELLAMLDTTVKGDFLLVLQVRAKKELSKMHAEPIRLLSALHQVITTFSWSDEEMAVAETIGKLAKQLAPPPPQQHAQPQPQPQPQQHPPHPPALPSPAGKPKPPVHSKKAASTSSSLSASSASKPMPAKPPSAPTRAFPKINTARNLQEAVEIVVIIKLENVFVSQYYRREHMEASIENIFSDLSKGVLGYRLHNNIETTIRRVLPEADESQTSLAYDGMQHFLVDSQLLLQREIESMCRSRSAVYRLIKPALKYLRQTPGYVPFADSVEKQWHALYKRYGPSSSSSHAHRKSIDMSPPTSTTTTTTHKPSSTSSASALLHHPPRKQASPPHGYTNHKMQDVHPTTCTTTTTMPDTSMPDTSMQAAPMPPPTEENPTDLAQFLNQTEITHLNSMLERLPPHLRRHFLNRWM
ncbi:hypothetical protein SYNPS1DRAFT_29948 [Syncephalis pseudoplumigaleata]|uniref:Uncharacterized protein n=1 Tax=Syncephalis pseudoplumigaleata TaxID=1712513 RepID=A0A4P9YWI0_9FUNG|nr:hypothetical protein SYNPS1DRAFT_29948 [Syncephalis pseudoplumigaleata]|eukprot:RKP24284.1 hypothetical protein SYNPS1DRAFT_29948 [Syncephalis pseudoplumigaleata]